MEVQRDQVWAYAGPDLFCRGLMFHVVETEEECLAWSIPTPLQKAGWTWRGSYEKFNEEFERLL